MPQLGVASGAAATVVSFVVATTWLGWRLRRLHSPLAPGRALAAHLRIDGGLLRGVLRVGVPTGVQLIVVSLAEIALLGLVNGYGSKATAAYGAVNQVVARSVMAIVPQPGRVVEGQVLFHSSPDRRGGAGGEVVDMAAIDPMGAKARSIRGAEISMVFQEPMTSLSPVHTIGNQIMEAILLHQPVSKQ